MKLRKMMAILLALCTVFFLAGCGGSGGGSDDEEDTATWPVEFYSAVGGGSPAPALKAAPATGTYKYIYFYKDNTYKSGDLNNGTLTQTGSGSYSGGDPHKNATLSLTGTFEGSNLNGESVSISSGSLTIAGKTFTAGGSSNGGNGGGSGGGDVTPPAVTWPVSYQCDISAMTGVEGTFGYIDFREDGTYIYGDGIATVKNDPDYDPSGTYTGDDPHADGSIRVTGHWLGGGNLDNQLITISGGVFDASGLNMVRQ